MPEHPLGRALTSLVEEPPHTLDVTDLLRRARRRGRVRRAALLGSAAATTALTVLLLSTVAGPSPSRPVTPAGQAPTTTPTDQLPVVPPTQAQTPPAVAPDVRGLAVDTAIAALTQADCEPGIGAVTTAVARVGQVIAQRTIGSDGLCNVALTISAGPATPAPTCTSLHVTNDTGGAGLGHVEFVVHLRNTGRSLCTLSGYPQLSATDSTGRHLSAEDFSNGYMGGNTLPGRLPPLRLAPDDQVSFMVEGTDNPVGNATSCPSLSRLRVTIGDRSYALTAPMPGCSGLEVHPYVPGTTGSLRYAQ